MKWIKFIIFNIFVGFVFIDGTIGITTIQEYSSNLIPFLATSLLLLSILSALLMVIIGAFADEWEFEQLSTIYGRLDKTTKPKVWINIIVDVLFTLLLAVHGFTISSFIYLLHLFVTLIAQLFKNEAINDMEEILHNAK